jgi:hypothetical protein
MKKQKNNPWYYYLNGNLVKERKPAMPGDLVLIDRELTSNCLFTVVSEVHIGGFHDHQRRYFKWDKVYKASKVLEELTDLRVFKEEWRNKERSLVDELLGYESAYHKAYEFINELQEDKTALINDLETSIEMLFEASIDMMMYNDEAFCNGQIDALKAILSKVKSGYHHPFKSSTTK